VIRRALTAATFAGACSAASGQTMRTFSTTRAAAGERELRATLDFSGGSLVIRPAAPGGELYSVQMRYDADRYAPLQQYDPRTGILHIGMSPAGGLAMRVGASHQPASATTITFSPDIPLSLYTILGASDATLDLGGLTLTDVEIRTSASHATVDFSRPDRGTCKSATFSVGAAELEVHHLAQAGCNALRVDGGAGSVTLDLDGAWRHDATLDVDLAMGKLLLGIPAGTGVELQGERFLAPFDNRGFVRSGNRWITPGFDQATHKLHVMLQASVVNIAIRWIQP
jgi:hypothetical protein